VPFASTEPPPPAVVNPAGRRTEPLIVAGLALAFVGMALVRLGHHPYPFYDDVGYLRLGQEVRSLGGPWRLLGALFDGSWKEANRHPLYLALLALLAGTDPGYHRRAQFLGVLLGLAALLTIWWAIRRFLGRSVALVSLGYLACNGALLEHSAREACEGLLLIFWTLSLCDFLRPERQGRRFARGGVWAGLAFLTKGTGVLLPLSAGLALVVHPGLRGRGRAAAAMAVAFATIASPLLVRNLRVFGAPFYNSNNRLMWNTGLPDFAESFAPDAERLLPHSLSEYLGHTSPRDVLHRFATGAAETAFNLLDALALASPRPGGPWHIVWLVLGLAVAAAGVRGLWRLRQTWCGSFGLCHLLTVTSFLVVYNAVAGSSRYFLPAVPLLVAPAAQAWLGWVERGRRRWLRGSTAAVLPLAALTTILFDRTPVAPPPGFVAAQSWLAAQVRPGETFAIDSRTQLQPEWLMPGRRQLVTSASWQLRPVASARLLSFFRESGARYLVVDGGSRSGFLPGRAPEPRYFFYDRVAVLADGSLPLTGWPEPLRVVYAGAEQPRRWLVLELP
jgi:4-amino-4-deoxy-L-arabinose transferase-like glycosyltransferase